MAGGQDRRVILGVDASLRSTGYAYRDNSGELIHGVIRAPKTLGVTRLYQMRANLDGLLNRVNPDVVAYEDYSFGSKHRAHATGELGGIFRLEIYQRGIDMLFIPPKSLKLFTTDDGNADKKEMIDQVKCDHHISEDIGDDQADAIALLFFGESFFKYHRVRTSRKRAAMGKCKIVRGIV